MSLLILFQNKLILILIIFTKGSFWLQKYMYTELYVAKSLDVVFTNNEAQAFARAIVNQEPGYSMRVRKQVSPENVDKGERNICKNK